MTKDQATVYIKAHLARGNRSTAKELAKIGGLIESNDTNPKTRSIIKSLIKGGDVIGSNSNGYKMLTNGKEVQLYLNSLLKRQIGISQRIQDVYNSATGRGLL